MKSRFEARAVKALMILLLGMGIALSGCAAGGANCVTSCKEGLREYSTSSRWVCIFDEGMTGGNFAPNRKTNEMLSACTLKISGHLKNVDSTFGGKYRTEHECFENFCVPRLAEICGMEDRCADARNWFDRPATRKYYSF